MQGIGQGTLTPRMDETLQHLIIGESEKEIALLLGLSRHTVHDYVKALHRHFGVCSRAELLATVLTDVRRNPPALAEIGATELCT